MNRSINTIWVEDLEKWFINNLEGYTNSEENLFELFPQGYVSYDLIVDEDNVIQENNYSININGTILNEKLYFTIEECMSCGKIQIIDRPLQDELGTFMSCKYCGSTCNI